MKRLCVLLASIGLLLLAAVASAQPYRGGYGYHMGPGGGYGYGQQQYSQRDYEVLNDLQNEYYQKTRKMALDLQQKNWELQAELNKKDIDKNKVLSLVDDVNKLRSELYRERIKYQMKLREKGFGGYGYGGYGRMGPGYGRHMMGPGYGGMMMYPGYNHMMDPEYGGYGRAPWDQQ